MARDKFKKFDFNINQDHVYQPTNENIDSDFKLVLSLLLDILIFIIMLIPNLIMVVFMFIFGNSIGAKAKFANILATPFRLIQKIFVWLLQAKFTAFLILILVLSYILQFVFITPNQILFDSLANNPGHLLEGNYYSVFTSLFLHADLIHLGTNLLALLIFGRIVEKQFGYKMLYIFFLGGIFSSIVSSFVWFSLGDLTPSIGASGAIASLIIFAILLDPLVFTTFFLIPVPIFVIGWVLIFLDISGLSNASRVNHFAHLAGYLALLVGFFFLGMGYRRRMYLGLAINAVFMIFIYLAIRMLDINLI